MCIIELLSVIDNITGSYIDNLNAIYKEVKERYEENKNIIAIADNETSDLLHEIELTKFNACRGWWLALEVKKVRERRRKAKNENELLNEFLLYINSKSGDSFKLDQIRSNSVKIHKLLLGKKYTSKVRTDLRCATKIRSEKYITSTNGGHRFNDNADIKQVVNGSNTTNFDKMIKDFKRDNKDRKRNKYR